MSDQKSAPDIDPEDIKAAEKAAGIEIVPEDEDLPPETAPDEKTADDVVIELEAQLAEVKADRLRAVAEAENTRKRAEREMSKSMNNDKFPQTVLALWGPGGSI